MDESTSMSKNLTKLHQDPSNYKKLHHEFKIWKQESENVKN